MSKEAPVELRKQELRQWAEGLLDEADAACRLAISIEELRMRSMSGRLIMLTVEGRPGYPAYQFDHLGIVPGLEAALDVMPIKSNWMRLEWLLTPDPTLEGSSPLAALKAGRIEEVVALARSHGVD